MAIPLTNLHKGRVVEQIKQNLIGLQNDMRRNAQTHKAMALAQSPPLEVLQSFVSDCAFSYLNRSQWMIDLRANTTKRQRLIDILTLMGWTETDLTDVAAPLRQAALALQSAPRTTFAEIITACDAVLVSIDAPESLWPE